MHKIVTRGRTVTMTAGRQISMKPMWKMAQYSPVKFSTGPTGAL